MSSLSSPEELVLHELSSAFSQLSVSPEGEQRQSKSASLPEQWASISAGARRPKRTAADAFGELEDLVSRSLKRIASDDPVVEVPLTAPVRAPVVALADKNVKSPCKEATSDVDAAPADKPAKSPCSNASSDTEAANFVHLFTQGMPKRPKTPVVASVQMANTDAIGYGTATDNISAIVARLRGSASSDEFVTPVSTRYTKSTSSESSDEYFEASSSLNTHVVCPPSPFFFGLYAWGKEMTPIEASLAAEAYEDYYCNFVEFCRRGGDISGYAWSLSRNPWRWNDYATWAVASKKLRANLQPENLSESRIGPKSDPRGPFTHKMRLHKLQIPAR